MAVRKVKHGRGHSYELTTKIDGKVIRRRFASIKEANDAYARLRGSALDGSYIPAADLRMTLDTYAAMFFDALRVREATEEIYRGHYRRHISPVLGRIAMSRLRRQNILALVKELEDKGLAPSTVKAVYNIAAMILRSAAMTASCSRRPASRSRCRRSSRASSRPSLPRRCGGCWQRRTQRTTRS